MLSPIAADHVQNPRNRGPLEGATNYGISGVRGEGAYVEIWLKVGEGRILAAAYRTPGCPSSTAAASLAAQLVIGRAPAQAALLTEQDLVTVLGGLPEGKGHFARMSAEALRKALEGGSRCP